MPDRIVLVTGFGPFGGAPTNPSTAVARSLDGLELAGVRFVAHAPLSVTYAGSTREALDAAGRIDADAILALGVAGGTRHVRIEKRAANVATSPDPDTKGESRRGVVADPSGPVARETSLDVEAIATHLRDAGLDVTTSHDAGGYVCNDLYYRLLTASTRLAGPRDILFVHVPSHAASLTALPRALATAFAAALGKPPRVSPNTP